MYDAERMSTPLRDDSGVGVPKKQRALSGEPGGVGPLCLWTMQIPGRELGWNHGDIPHRKNCLGILRTARHPAKRWVAAVRFVSFSESFQRNGPCSPHKKPRHEGVCV